MLPFSLYLHIPFCLQRCGYCDFNTYAGQIDNIPAYVEAIRREIAMVGRAALTKITVHTIFFGGGTPSLLTAAQISAILAAIHESYQLTPDVEISIEANPGTVTKEFLVQITASGVNRLSLGMQSAQPHELHLLNRLHTLPDVFRAVEWARQAGFDNLNLDLIYGLPGQTLAEWQESLEVAVNLMPEHLSLYCLTIEPGTPLFRLVKQARVVAPDDDLAAEMFEWAINVLPDKGYTHYEISNWARSTAYGSLLAARHNLQYWRNQPYLGFGAGAHGYAAGMRTANVKRISAYLRRMQGLPREFPLSPATDAVVRIAPLEEMRETMMVGLRLLQEGVSAAAFARRFGVALEAVFGQEIQELLKLHLIAWQGEGCDRLVLTRRGTMLGNQVFMRFVSKGD